MLDLRFVRENMEVLREKLAQRRSDVDLAPFIELDRERRELIQRVENLRNERNRVTDQISVLKRQEQDAEALISRMKETSQEIKNMEEVLREKEDGVRDFLLNVPNVPHGSVPTGGGEEDNPVVRTWGDVPQFSFQPKAHWDIGEELDILDFKRGPKLAGARFTLYKGLGARLERSLINFMLDVHTGDHGYQEVLPPFMVNRDVMTGTGQLPKFEEDLFKIDGMDYFLIPTAEVPVTNMYRDEVLAEEDLPLHYCAYTPCFRKEAGSYGRDTRGIIRQHQFNKVELVTFAVPGTSYEELERLTANAEEILRRLEIHYRVTELCTGDLGFSASKTYDIEAWLPGQGTYVEISSCSNFEDFQARRANIRFRPKGRKGTELVHTLNGSGLAVGRTVVAILENYQQKDGSVLVPEVLRSYMGGVEKITRMT
jgi:seryl-tRNA synthetase